MVVVGMESGGGVQKRSNEWWWGVGIEHISAENLTLLFVCSVPGWVCKEGT